MGEGVAEQVRMQLGHAGQGAAAAEDLGEAGIGQAPAFAQPQPGRLGVEVQLADSEVSVQGAAGLAVEGAGPWTAALPSTSATSWSKSTSSTRSRMHSPSRWRYLAMRIDSPSSGQLSGARSSVVTGVPPEKSVWSTAANIAISSG